MKKSFIKKSFFSFLILILVFALASCSNWFESSVDEMEAKIEEEITRQEEKQAKAAATSEEVKKIDFYGSMFFTGAMPEIVADEIRQAAENVNASTDAGEVNARAALPEIDESLVEYFVRAVDTDDNTINGTFPDAEHPASFSLYLIYGKTYTITCGMKKTGTGGAEFLTATSDSITVTTSNASDPIVLYPQPVTGGLGEVDLEMSVPPSITNVTVSCTGTNSTDWKINTVDFTAGSGSTNGSAKLETGSTDAEKIPAGVYNIILNFHKGDEVVFTTQQKINIFTGLKTNLWKDSSSLAVTSKAIQNDGSFVLTENIIKLYLSTHIYVGTIAGVTGADSNIGTHKRPLATLGEALSRISEYGDEEYDYFIYISGEQKPAASATSGFEIPDTFDTKIKTLTIRGVNNRETDILDGDARFSTLKINSSKNVTIKDLTIRNGNVLVSSSDSGYGGGIQKFGSGQLTVDNCIIRGNTAVKGGGGICSFQFAGDCKINNCLIESNTAAESNGGGLYSRAETDIINTIIKSNSAAGSGGGIYAIDKPLKIYGSQTLISENTASGHGGGICTGSSSSLTFSDGIISKNEAQLRGGGINSDVPVTMTSGTITGNKSLGTAEDNTCGGGGVAIRSTFEMKGGLIKDNYARVFGGGVFIFDVNAKLFLSGNAVIGDITQDSPAESDNDKHSNSSGKGGGIFNRGKIYAGYTDESTPDPSFSGGIGYNYASIHGGGIYSIGSGTAEVYIYKAKISENTSETFGGGFDIYNGTIEINNSIIENNKGGKGGGINLGRADGSPISVIKNTNINNNLSTSRGGGIFFFSGSLTMSDVQITDNHSDVTGGGFFNDPTGTKTLTFGSNAAESTVTIKNNTQGAAEPYAKSNIYLNATDVITVAGALSSTSEIWVSSATSSGTFTDGFGTTNIGTTPSSIFKSDEDLEIYADSDGEASFTAGSGGGGANAIPLTLEAVSSAATVSFQNKASGPVTYKVNGGAAVEIASGTTGEITLEAAGDKVEFYGNNEAYGVSASSNCSKISCTADCYVYGNIMSLINSSSYEDLTELTHTYTFAYLFVGNSKIKNKTGANLLLPATTLANYCYYQMFKECTGLTAAPELPATTLARYCYQAMFKECTGLTAAPELPATTLAYYCYYDMFNGCTGLTAAPELPATTLADRCYYDMFKGCTGLTAAPELPATTLASYCYYCMFQGCTGLTAAPALPATTLADFCYEGMFYGCTSLTAAPELPATTLTDYCYEGMFYGCTSLTAAPELPATTLASYCYCGMFQGCTNLNSVTCLATDISASNCVENWLSGVASTGTFTKASAMTDWPLNSESGIPSGWTY